jgi:flagellar biosynthesis component FlhA
MSNKGLYWIIAFLFFLLTLVFARDFPLVSSITGFIALIMIYLASNEAKKERIREQEAQERMRQKAQEALEQDKNKQNNGRISL